MSITLSVNRAVGSIVDPETQEIFYALFEKTASSNVSPRDYTWDCIGFGKPKEMLDRIYSLAAATAGGMLQSNSGYFTPHGYANAWLREMRNPFQIQAENVSRWIDKKRFEKALSQSDRLNRVWNTPVLKAIDDGGPEKDFFNISFSIKDHPWIAAELTQRHVCPAFGLFKYYRVTQHLPGGDKGIPYAPARKRSLDKEAIDSLPKLPEMRRLSRSKGMSTVWTMDEDSSWEYAGLEYEVLQSYVEKMGEVEYRYPGTASRLIKAAIAKISDRPVIKNVQIIPKDRDQLEKSSELEDLDNLFCVGELPDMIVNKIEAIPKKSIRLLENDLDISNIVYKKSKLDNVVDFSW